MGHRQDRKSEVILERSILRFALATSLFHNKGQSEPESSCKYLRQHWTLDVMESTQSECDWFGGAVECSDDGWVGIPKLASTLSLMILILFGDSVQSRAFVKSHSDLDGCTGFSREPDTRVVLQASMAPTALCGVQFC